MPVETFNVDIDDPGAVWAHIVNMQAVLRKQHASYLNPDDIYKTLITPELVELVIDSWPENPSSSSSFKSSAYRDLRRVIGLRFCRSREYGSDKRIKHIYLGDLARIEFNRPPFYGTKVITELGNHIVRFLGVTEPSSEDWVKRQARLPRY